MTNDEIRGFIENAIQENQVMLFMKGTPNQPACGFSARTAGALNTLGVQYAALDILPDPRIREELSGLSGWPSMNSRTFAAAISVMMTMPRLYRRFARYSGDRAHEQ